VKSGSALVVILSIFVSLAMSSISFADDLLLCVNTKDGTARVVSAGACKNNETLITLPKADRITADETRITNTEAKNATQDSQILAIQQKNTQQDAAIAALQNEASGGALVVKDSQGQTVGKWVSFPASSVFIQIGNNPLRFQVNSQGFLVNGNNFNVFFTTPDCSGTIFIPSARANAGDFADFVGTSDGVTGYFPTSPAQSQTLLSSRPLSGTQCSPVNITTMAGAAGTIDLSALNLVPPFHLE